MDKRLQLLGWVLFTICGAMWILQSAYSMEIIDLLVGIIWTIGCLIFIVDLQKQD